MRLSFLRVFAVMAIAAVVAGCGDDGGSTGPKLKPQASVLRATGSDPVSGASITTDLDDYLPGEVVHLNGAGWTPGETVNLAMSEDPDTHPDISMDVQADSVGAFSVHFYDVQTSDLGATFTLVATGGTSGSSATVVFTDGRAISSVTLNGVSTVTVAAGSSIAAVVNGALTGNGANTLGSIGVRVYLNSASASTAVSLTCYDVNPDKGPSSPSVSIPFTESFSFNAPSASGTYNVIVSSHAGDVCATPGAFDFAIANGIAIQASNTAPTLAAIGAKSVNEGSALTFTASGTDTDTPAQTLTYSLVGAPGGATINSSSGAFSWTPTDGPAQTATFTVKVTDNGTPAMSDEEAITVTVNNVAPTATWTAPTSVSGGLDIELSLTSPVDPSSVDVTAGFTYAFDCGTGSGYAAYSSTNTASCPTSGTGSRTVKGKIKDKDGDETEYTKSVAINNVPPTADAGGPYSGNEGATLNISGTASDPDGGAVTYEWTVAPTGTCSFGSATSLSTTVTCNDNGTFTLTFKATDDEGASTSDDATLTVANVKPTATFNAPSPVNEGTAISLSLTSVVDPGSADVISFQFDCGTGSGYSAASSTASASCPTNDNGSRTVKGKVLDDDGGFTEYTLSVTIDNVDPTATFNAPSSVDEGSPIGLSLTGATDASSVDAASLQFAFDCGSGYGSFSATASTSCPTSNDGSRTVKGTVKDKDGGSTEYTASVTINNVAPVVDAGAATASLNEGDTFTRSGSFTDPGSDLWTATVDYGDGSGSQSLILSGKDFNLSHTYADNGSFTVTVTVNDDDTSGSDQITVTVANVAPTLSSITASPALLAVNNSTSLTLVFTDPAGTNDTYSAWIDWDDAVSPTFVNAGTLTSGGSKTHTYTAAGVYRVRAYVTDEDGGTSSTLSYEFVVVYDPSAGFVTGGGWIDSPAGAYVAAPSLTGKATFGFVSKYLKGANTPIGNTEFQFHAAGMNFSSTVYQWLVVSGTMAQYKGDGTINGVGGFGFLLSAVDGSTDKFRIKIWDKNNGNAVIYDNQMTAAEDAVPTTSIASGSIVIHTTKK